ncbi:long-chain-fatty-acid--CoA ligase 1-like [Anastrepha obliqua]|uniref:long-chain-fatty-acid--CoA ligase 1-like n=1 Tax=Anastrepha obliqua TaxID=95512 RepID=UPI0024095B09|nr:long-chain-fatty-acid--CoA ligase 1-like [Anastrepha obliqua]
MMRIIDRRKHIFKLSQGEYIVPEKIENIYTLSQYVNQVYVYGESLKSCIIAVVVPDVDVLKQWANDNRVKGIRSDMLNWGKQSGLKSFEQVKDIPGASKKCIHTLNFHRKFLYRSTKLNFRKIES